LIAWEKMIFIQAKRNAATVSLSLVPEQIRKLWHKSLVIAAAVNNVMLALLHKADCISVWYSHE
jgi:hypothetical protein